MKLLEDERGFGVEDSPFMILATVAVLLLVVAMGIQVMGNFVSGNQYQAAGEAAMTIYKRAKLLSLSYHGSYERFAVSIPERYAVRVDGNIVALKNVGFLNNTLQPGYGEIGEPLIVRGVDIIPLSGDVIPPGRHEVNLTYSTENGPKIFISWD